MLNQSLKDDGKRLLRAKQAMEFLHNMSSSTFYRKIKLGLIPKQQYFGATPVWRQEDLWKVSDQLFSDSLRAEDRSSSK